MQLPLALLTWLTLAAPVEAVKLRDAEAISPMAKVVQLIEGLEAKVTKEGGRQEETHLKFQSWCRETNATKNREMKTAEGRKEKFSAIVSKTTAQAQAAGEKIIELQAAVAEAQDDLANATSQREKEAADFQSNEQQLVEAHDTASRAISVLKDEAKSKPALLQALRTPFGRGAGGELLTTLGALADAAVLDTEDADQLQELLLMQKQSLAAPEADAYTPQHAGIVDLLDDMLDKTKSQLGDLRKAESDAKHNFEMLRQSLEDQISIDQKALASQRAGKLEAERTRSSAQGELEAATSDFDEAARIIEEVSADCEQSAADYESSVAARAEELNVLKEAKEILKQSVPAMLVQTGGYSLLQLASTGQQAAGPMEAVRRLARQHNSVALAQLVSHMEAAFRLGDRAGEDPFEKVRGLVSQMIARLEEQRSGDLKKEEYCDRELNKAAEKKEDLENSHAKANAKLEKATSLTASLQEEIAQLRENMATDQQEQKELTEIRQQEHQDFIEAKEDLEQGLEGVRKAQSVLSDYYEDSGSGPPEAGAFLQEAPPMPASFQKSQAGGGILQILEQAETDMASSLAAAESKESAAAEEYEKTTKEAGISMELQKNDLKHKSQQAAALKKQLSELASDNGLAGEELAAVKEYEEQLKQQCTIKGESYEERKAKREAEIAGLRDAVQALGSA